MKGALPALVKLVCALAQRGVVFGRLASRHRDAAACLATQLAARIAISNLHKSTLKSFSET